MHFLHGDDAFPTYGADRSYLALTLVLNGCASTALGVVFARRDEPDAYERTHSLNAGCACLVDGFETVNVGQNEAWGTVHCHVWIAVLSYPCEPFDRSRVAYSAVATLFWLPRALLGSGLASESFVQDWIC